MGCLGSTQADVILAISLELSLTHPLSVPLTLPLTLPLILPPSLPHLLSPFLSRLTGHHDGEQPRRRSDLATHPHFRRRQRRRCGCCSSWRSNGDDGGGAALRQRQAISPDLEAAPGESQTRSRRENSERKEEISPRIQTSSRNE